MNINTKDIRIIEQLNDDGRLSLRKMADKLDYSPSTVGNHFHKLVDKGVIKGFRPRLDYKKMGFSFTIITQIKTVAGLQKEVAETLSERGYIHSLYQVTGDSDLIAICKFQSREEMRRNLTRDLNSMDGVSDTSTNVALDEKVEGRPIDLNPLKDRSE